jgi:hypothetical protein
MATVSRARHDRRRTGRAREWRRTESEARPGAQARLLELQRLAGNQAVTSLVRNLMDPGASPALPGGVRAGAGTSLAVQRHPGPRGHTHPKDDESEDSSSVVTVSDDSEDSTHDSEFDGGDSAKEESEIEDPATGAGRAGNIMDAINSPTGAAFSGSYLPSYSTAPTGGNVVSNAGSLANPSLSIVTGIMGIGLGAAKLHRAKGGRAERRADEKKGKKGDAGDRLLTRDIQSGAADTGQGVASVTGNTLNVAYGALNNYAHAAQMPAYSVATAAGFVTTPLAAFQTGRAIRKAEKARRRVDRLTAVMNDEGKVADALKAAQERWTELAELAYSIQEDLVEANAALNAALAAKPPNAERINSLRSEVATLERMRTASQDQVARAGRDRDEQQVAAKAMHEAIRKVAAVVNRDTAGVTDEVNLLMVQAYALKKNHRGWVKKAITAVGGALGTAGGAASLVASIALAAGAAAGAGILVATPIGWALAGAATVVGLGLAGYQAWKFYSRRWQLTRFDPEGNERTTLDRIRQTLDIRKKVGPSKRDGYADALYRMATDDQDAVLQKEARATIEEGLELDWNALGMESDADNAKKLIAAKLGS